MIYRKEPQYRLLIPGYGGLLADHEQAYVQDHLQADGALSFWWGWRPSTRRWPLAAIMKVAMLGSMESRSHNVMLVREAGRRPKEGDESGSPCVKNLVKPGPPRLGRREVESWESELLRLAASGLGIHKIAKTLKAQYGVAISGPTVSTRIRDLRELQGQLRLLS
jgi:hypothetical protein